MTTTTEARRAQDIKYTQRRKTLGVITKYCVCISLALSVGGTIHAHPDYADHLPSISLPFAG